MEKRRAKAWKTAQHQSPAGKKRTSNPASKQAGQEITSNPQAKRSRDQADQTNQAPAENQQAKKLKVASSHGKFQRADDSSVLVDEAVKPGAARETSTSHSVLEPLTTAYEVSVMNIISSAKVESKVTRILDTLSAFSFSPASKPSIVLVRAKAGTASKMISIVEIAKRNLAAEGFKWYQYNGLEQSVEERKLEKPVTILGRKVEPEADEDVGMAADEGAAFETLMTPLERAIDGRPKIRAVPVMTIYLSRVPIENLRAAYG